MVFWPWKMGQNEWQRPSGHILHLPLSSQNQFLDYSYIFKMWTQNGSTFCSFFDLPTSKKTGPQRKKDAHGPSLHIRFLSKCHFWYGIYTYVPSFPEKSTFLNYCQILIILCISDSKMGDPRLLLFQNGTLISKLEPYPKGIFHQIWDPSIALSCSILL